MKFLKKFNLSEKSHPVATTLVLYIAAVVVQLNWITPSGLLNAISDKLDLSGSWEFCNLNTDPANLSLSELKCEKRIQVPSDIPRGTTGNGWYVFRTHFETPDFCLKTGLLCSAVFAEIGDAAEISLNGRTLGRNGDFPPNATYAKHFPFTVDLPRDLLVQGKTNVLELLVYTLKKEQTGIRKRPVAVVPHHSAMKIVRIISVQGIIIPLLGSLGVLLLTAFSFFFVVFNEVRDKRIFVYLRYTTAAGLFLVSFTEIAREHLPISLVGCLHFLLRFLQDWLSLELAYSIFKNGKPVLFFARIAYPALLVTFITQYLCSYFLVDFPLAGFDGAVYVSRWALPLVLLPYLYGLIAGLRKSQETGISIALIFGLTFLLQLHDGLAFNGWIKVAYFTKFYPFFVALSTGIFLWTDYFLQLERIRSEANIGKLAAQVAHDIRSPLAALKSVISGLTLLPEEERTLIRRATNRIADISNNLLEAHRTASKGSALAHGNSLGDGAAVQLLSSLIDELITEKRQQYRSRLNVEIDAHLGPDSYGLFAQVNPTEFSRVISNLVNNAVEALLGKGRVWIEISGKKDSVTVSVQDNGKGIPPEILATLTKHRQSFGKDKGSGLGLSHARTSVELWGGQLQIRSEVQRGTTVTLTLPKAPPPSWFVREFQVKQNSYVVILDDDETIHGIWRSRTEFTRSQEKGIQLLHFLTPDELKNWKKQTSENGKSIQYLLDYELLGFKQTGLDLIEELGIASESILVTNRYEEPDVREWCQELNIPILPKSMAWLVPISIFQKTLSS